VCVERFSYLTYPLLNTVLDPRSLFYRLSGVCETAFGPLSKIVHWHHRFVGRLKLQCLSKAHIYTCLGVISYATNANTAAVVAQMAKDHPEQPLRILLETDAPYMIPSNIYNDLSGLGRKKLPLSHSAMIPWTAKWVADAVGELWDADLVMLEARENARIVYGV